MKNPRYSSSRFHLLLFAAVLLISFLIFVIPGCNGGTLPDSSTGTLSVSLTDAPSCGFDAVNVTVSKVRIHQSSSATENDAGWTEILLAPARKINLLDLTNGALTELGQTPLAAGRYTQLRLVLAENSGAIPANSVILAGGSNEIALSTPSGMQSGFKLINGFDVLAGERVDLVVDFDACKSVVNRGNGSYGLKPVLRVIPFTLNGIEGFVAPALLGANVAVSAQRSGTVVRSTVPNAQGKFYLARIEPGSYDVVITADSHATAVVAGVPIASATSTTTISTVAAPLTLPIAAMQRISGTITLNPASATEVAYAAAKQTFLLGPTVTVKAQGVDPSYALTLPTAAPLLGQFGSGTLPILFNAENAIAGQYSIEATASGYQTQAFGKNISSADASQDFVLTP